MGGYSPIPCEGKIPPLNGWNGKSYNDDEINLWTPLYPYATNTGAHCKFMPTFDLDISNAVAAQAVEDLIRSRNEEFGAILTRFGNSPRRAIPFRTDVPFKKMTANLITPNGAQEKIEVLCDGQQVVVHGMHPETKRPYEWPRGSPFDVPFSKLPYISEQDAREQLDDCVDLLVREHGYSTPQMERPAQDGKPNGGSADWGYLYEEIRAGRELHKNTTILAAKLIASGMIEGAAVNIIRSALDKSQAPHDDRWQERYDDIPRLVESAIGEYRTKKPKPDAERASGTNAGQLKAMAFNPVQFLVINLIPSEGVTLICAKPKSGKSWLVLDLALASTMNRITLGESRPLQGSVLYLALEDSLRRLRSRIDRLLPSSVTKWPEHLRLETEWKRVDDGGLDDIRKWVEGERVAGRTVAFVAVDVLKIVRPATVKGKPAYEADYDALTGLQRLARDLSIAILVVHHTRKADSDDLLDKVSGTFGLSGAADTILILEKRSNGWVFDVRGRDVSSDELAAEFNKDTCRWAVLGSAAEVHQTSERNAVLAIFREHGSPLTVELVTEHLADLSPTQSHSHSAVKQILSRMARNGLLRREKRGLYSLLESTQSRSHEEREEAF
jgi:hypothetical protein